MPQNRTYRFVEASGCQKSRNQQLQRTIRSHAARLSHPGPSRRQLTLTKRLWEGEAVVTFDSAPGECDKGDTPDTAPGSNQAEPPEQSRAPDATGHGCPIYVDLLSGRTFSPIQHLSTYRKPYLPGIINHYIYNLVIPIPELDGNTPVLVFRNVWLPIVFHDPVVFEVVMLFAATHYATYAKYSQYENLPVELLALKQCALSAMIRAIRCEQSVSSTPVQQEHAARDILIAAAAKMAGYEAIFGTREVFHLHMATVTRLLRLQGGLSGLGMNGFLARLLTFIDTNSAFLLGTNLYLLEFGLLNRMPHHQPFPPNGRDSDITSQVQARCEVGRTVNLERFIGSALVHTQ